MELDSVRAQAVVSAADATRLRDEAAAAVAARDALAAAAEGAAAEGRRAEAALRERVAQLEGQARARQPSGLGWVSRWVSPPLARQPPSMHLLLLAQVSDLALEATRQREALAASEAALRAEAEGARAALEAGRRERDGLREAGAEAEKRASAAQAAAEQLGEELGKAREDGARRQAAVAALEAERWVAGSGYLKCRVRKHGRLLSALLRGTSPPMWLIRVTRSAAVQGVAAGAPGRERGVACGCRGDDRPPARGGGGADGEARRRRARAA